jgi:hypothetical protein
MDLPVDGIELQTNGLQTSLEAFSSSNTLSVTPSSHLISHDIYAQKACPGAPLRSTLLPRY